MNLYTNTSQIHILPLPMNHKKQRQDRSTQSQVVTKIGPEGMHQNTPIPRKPLPFRIQTDAYITTLKNGKIVRSKRVK